VGRPSGVWQRGAVLKKVPPEILFIEACYRFLKPGTGVMAIVVPDGILGNPGVQMEAVRWWMLSNMELLASVDLPAETFLPQVSVQASCLILRRRHVDEQSLADPTGLANDRCSWQFRRRSATEGVASRAIDDGRMAPKN